MNFQASRKYPKKLHIGENEWALVIKEKLEDDALGLCEYSTRTIYIRSKLNRVIFLSTLVHEVLHVFEDEYDIKLSHKVVYQLERAIMEFLIANY